jgi:hypothetical protein
MRLVLRFSMLMAVAGLASSQAITDAAAAIAGGSVGAGAGKQVGEGISNVFNKVGATTNKAAKLEPAGRAEKPLAKGSAKSGKTGETVLQVGPGGVVKDHSLVPPPPPPAKKVLAVVPPPPPVLPVVAPAAIARAPLPPPPQVTADDLKSLASGTSRAEVLKLGAPASRVTMVDDSGRLIEIFRYQSSDRAFGTVRLSEGSVSSVQVR